MIRRPTAILIALFGINFGATGVQHGDRLVGWCLIIASLVLAWKAVRKGIIL